MKINGKKIFLVLLMVYLFLPVLVIILFSFSGRWETTILPQSYTLMYYKKIFSDPDFITALINTIKLSLISTTVSVIILVPCIYLTTLRFKFIEKFFDVLSVLPFILPGVILAIGLIELYSGSIFDITGTMWIVLGAYFVLCLPFMYQSIKNSFRSINSIRLIEAAQVLGCGEFEAFCEIIIPCILKGIMSAVLLSISILFGEFVLVNLLAGSSCKTIQVYLFEALSTDGHTASAIVSVYLVVIFAISYTAIMLSGKKRKMEE